MELGLLPVSMVPQSGCASRDVYIVETCIINVLWEEEEA